MQGFTHIKYSSDFIPIMTWFLKLKELNIAVLLAKLKHRHAGFTPEREKAFLQLP